MMTCVQSPVVVVVEVVFVIFETASTAKAAAEVALGRGGRIAPLTPPAGTDFDPGAWELVEVEVEVKGIVGVIFPRNIHAKRMMSVERARKIGSVGRRLSILI